MSILHNLGEIAYGAFRSYVESQAEHRITYAAQSDGYSFPAHMRLLARETGLPLVSVEAESAGFSLTVSDKSYAVCIAITGETITIDILSGLRFPPKRAPRDICEILVEQNRKMPRCDYKLMDSSKAAYFYVECAIHYASLTPQAFEAAVNELAPKIMGLDGYLVEQGYVR